MLRQCLFFLSGSALVIIALQSASGQAPTAPPAPPPTSATPKAAVPVEGSSAPPVAGDPGLTKVRGGNAPAVPAAIIDPNGKLPSIPAAKGDYQLQSVPPAPPAGPPVLVPAPATPDRPVQAIPAYLPQVAAAKKELKLHYGSTYIPVDSWIYPAMSRLYSLGFADTIFLGLRPWTRQSVLHMIENTAADVVQSDDEEAIGILSAIKHELFAEETNDLDTRGLVYGPYSAYDRVTGISGQTLRDSYHLGETIANDYGRPYAPGFNNILGFSTIAEWGRFSLDVRGEYQHAPATVGYTQATAAQLSQGIFGTSDTGDAIPFTGANLHQPDIPTGNIGSANPFRLIEANLSYHLLDHEISVGKSDAWLGPAQGGAMAWSNNADDIYSFRINRVEPLHIPLLSWLIGPVRYDFFYGSLKGHTAPNDDWAHSENLSFRPYKSLEFSFQRTIVFGGKGHEPVTLHTFLKGFFDPNDTTTAEKFSRDDPGARFTDFAASWRLPFLEKYATLYVDSEAHDDVSTISAPRRAAYRTGLYLSQLPGARKLDLRVEAATTDPGVSRSNNGSFNYYETVQQQAYTNEGVLFGDPIGREAKGGNAWLTYHLSGNEWVQVSYLNKKNEKDFIPGLYNATTSTFGPGGTTQNQFKIDVVKRFDHDMAEVHASYQHESWKAPIYLPGAQSNNVFSAQVTFYPKLKTSDAHLSILHR